MTSRNVKMLVAGVAALVLGAASAGSVSSMPARADLTIRHAVVGCHVWSVNDGALGVAQTVVVSEGQSISVTNRDDCGLRLVQTAGPEGVLSTAKTVEPLGPLVRVAMHEPGVYRFVVTDDPAADYAGGDAGQEFGLARSRPTIGPDNVLTLTVRVVPTRLPSE